MPTRIALGLCSFGRPAAARPMTTALSPARTRSIMMTCKRDVKNSITTTRSCEPQGEFSCRAEGYRKACWYAPANRGIQAESGQKDPAFFAGLDEYQAGKRLNRLSRPRPAALSERGRDRCSWRDRARDPRDALHVRN